MEIGAGRLAEADAAGSAGVEVELTEPITISFWHGIVQEDMQKTLAEIVDKFNNGIGKEMGITVESFAQGEMPDLENAVTAAIKAGNTPNVSLTEAAAAANWLQADCMVDLTPYIENENYGLDLDDYYDVYIQDSRSYAKPGGSSWGASVFPDGLPPQPASAGSRHKTARRAIALFFMSFPPNLLFSVFLAAVSPRELPLNAAGSRALHNLFMKDHV